MVLAHRLAQETRHDPPRHAAAKFGLLRDLYRRGYPQEEIERRYVIIDWLLRLPEPLERATWREIQEFVEEQQMNYITSAERFAREAGQFEGRVEGLTDAIGVILSARFGEAGLALLPAIRGIADPARLQAILRVLADATALDEVRVLAGEGV